MRRPFAELLKDLVGSIQPTGQEADLLRIVEVSFDLPIEVSLGRCGQEADFRGDLPVWRWRTVFDLPAGRLHVHFAKEGTP
jgi:hypothetical protein